MPRLFEGKRAQDELRVWVAGCATGEEAYSIAVLLLEHADTLAEPPRVQVFATDLSEQAVRTARAGSYPESIEADVSPERLRRFFSHEAGRYRVAERVREAVLFAPHSLLADPPFSRMDLVSCRNVLIYFQRALQQRALALFHYALAPGGLLFLGTSESPDVGPELFGVLDKRARLYRRLATETPPAELPHTPRVLHRPLPVSAADTVAGTAAAEPPPAAEPTELERVHRALREEEAPPSVLVSAGGDVVHASAGAAPFLQVTTGAPTHALTRVLRPELRAAAQTALFQARREGRPAASGPAHLELGGELRPVAVRARPAPGGALVQVAFDVLPGGPPEAAADASDAGGVLAEALRQAQEQLQVSAEEFETSREELRAQNEELQSLNEELRSTAEELETSKEEAQSMAEELRTVNDELKSKVDETARAKGDLENLIASTEIATLFLDRKLRIQRFTPHVRDLFHVLASDVGRPLGHLAQKFGGARLVEDAEAVIERLEVKEREVEGEDGRWHLVHARPYRTAEDRIDGVVITFVDITRRKADEAALRASAERAAFRSALTDALRDHDDPEGMRTTAARLLAQHLGAGHVHYAELEPSGERPPGADLGLGSDGKRVPHGLLGTADGLEPVAAAFAGALRAGRTLVVPDLGASAALPAGSRPVPGTAALVAAPLVEGGRLRAVLSVHHSAPRAWADAEVALVEETAERTRAAVDRARAEAELRAGDALFDVTLSNISDFVYTFDRDGRFVFVNQTLLDLWDLPLSDAVGKTFHELDYPEALADRLQRQIEQVFTTGRGLTDETPYTGADGEEGVYEYIFRPLLGEDGEVQLVVGSTRDVTARRKAELALREEARRAAFRAALADALRAASDPVVTQAEAARVLGEHLSASRVHYAELEPGGEHAVVARDYTRGVADRSGRYALADYPALIALARAGRTLVVPDVSADERLSAEEKEELAGLPVAALVVVPLVKDGRLVALLAVHHDAPRAWTDDEVALVEETAERTKAATERAAAEAALRRSQERLRQVAETVPDVLFRTAPDGTITFVNGQFETLTGRSAAEVEGTAVWPGLAGVSLADKGIADEGLVHEDDVEATEAAWAAARSAEKPFEVRHRLRTADGWRWVIMRARPFHDAEGRLEAWFGTATDVDGLTRAEEEVRQLNATLEDKVSRRTEQVRRLAARLAQAEQEERRRIALVLHDELQQLLAGLAITHGMLWENPNPEGPSLDGLRPGGAAPGDAAPDGDALPGDALPDETRALQAQADEFLAEAASLTRSLASEISPPALRSTDLAEALRWLASRKRELHRLDVTVEVDGACEVADAAVRHLLYNALNEVLFNVAKHAGTQRATVRARCDAGDAVVVEVEDEGEGFDTGRVGAGEGGLGLFSVRERVEMVGGRFEVESKPGHGTRVTIAVPAGGAGS